LLNALSQESSLVTSTEVSADTFDKASEDESVEPAGVDSRLPDDEILEAGAETCCEST
jgi:hypothetical protein